MKQIPQMEPLIGEAEKQALAEYMDSGGFLVEYKETEKFEKMLADFLRVKYVSLVPSGTVALYLSLLAADASGIVLVPDFTMIATLAAVEMANLTPKLSEIDEESLCLDLSKIDTRGSLGAMIYVDINGRGGDIEAASKFCRKNNIVLIEDACQAFGSRHRNGQALGTFGRFGCFSLSFHKIITTGQGGFIVTHTRKDYETIERLKDYGRLRGGKDYHPYKGYNFKYTDLQAVVGMEQLKTINSRIATKRTIYELYHDKPCSAGYVPWFIEHYSRKRNKLAKHLEEKGVSTRPFYPPIHTQPIYKLGGFPVTSRVSRTGLWLPSSLTLSSDEIVYVKEVIANADI